MKFKNLLPLFFMAGWVPLLFQCGPKPDTPPAAHPVQVHFTHADSVTEIFLMLEDSLLDAWNKMLGDDNDKIKAMKSLVHEMKISSPYPPEELASLETRIDQLVKMRYTPRTIPDTDTVEAYDFASNSLVTEIIAMAESLSSFSYNTTIQKLVEKIRSADLRVDNYRAEYDSIALAYNRFIGKHAASIKEATDSDTIMKKATFGLYE